MADRYADNLPISQQDDESLHEILSLLLSYLVVQIIFKTPVFKYGEYTFRRAAYKIARDSVTTIFSNVADEKKQSEFLVLSMIF